MVTIRLTRLRETILPFFTFCVKNSGFTFFTKKVKRICSYGTWCACASRSYTTSLDQTFRKYFRPQIGIHDIDIDGDVPDQIQRSLAVVHEAWAEVESSMAKLVTQADTVENESLLVELGRRMTDMEKHLTSLAGGSAKPW